jgi:hypothetical protein
MTYDAEVREARDEVEKELQKFDLLPWCLMLVGVFILLLV